MNNDGANCIVSTVNGEYVVAGYTYSVVSGYNGGGDMWVVKLNSAGAAQWSKTLGGTDNDEAHSITLMSDGGYIVAGYSASTNGNIAGPSNGSTDFFLSRITAAGNVIRLYEDAPE